MDGEASVTDAFAEVGHHFVLEPGPHLRHIGRVGQTHGAGRSRPSTVTTTRLMAFARPLIACPRR